MLSARFSFFRKFSVSPILVALFLVLSNVDTQAQESNTLRYRWKANETLVYHVTIEVDRGDYQTILSGYPTYQVKKADQDSIQFGFSGLLNESQKSEPGKRVLFRGPPRSPFSPFTGVSPGGLGRTGPTNISMNTRGEIISKTGSTQLPFLLGNLSELMLELLPQGNEKIWNESTEISISLSSGRLPRPSILRDDKKLIRAKQVTTYTRDETIKEGIRFNKEFSLRTTETIQGEPRFEIVGSGTVVFNADRGVPVQLNFEQTVIEREANNTEKTPLKIRYRLLNEEERKKLAASRKVTLENLSTNKNTKTSNLSGDEKQTMLSNLDPANPRSLGTVLKLQKQTPEKPDPEIAEALVKFLKSDDQSKRYAAMKALENWATPESKLVLIESLEDSFPIVRHSAMIALARLNDEKTTEAIAEKLNVLQDRLAATKALTAMGAGAEGAVAKQAEAKDWQTRLAVVRILKDIGTEKSTETLQKLSSDSNALIKREAGVALKNIQSRK